jgi:hypothetical protein
VIGRNSRPVDLWWSGKHRQHGGNVQVITGPDGWPIWTSDVRPGRVGKTIGSRTLPRVETNVRGKSRCPPHRKPGQPGRG